ncbi:MAG: acyl-CoA dehydrogenase C-terminal domain-containing protein, partial [Alphaproteobacteria bacterium]|nr:acyl-CoA dehydrogenase C-terminal domain-containing protein [Alphaproteobacteria bacterium]
ALTAWIGLSIDIAEKDADLEARAAAEDLVALMTPILKSQLTDDGFAAANLGLQIMGGHGYIREHGMEQLVRDVRITQIYEGANGIQGLDLVGRKLPMANGRLLRRFFHPAERFIAAHRDEAALQEFVLPFAKAFGKLQQATILVAQRGMRDPEEGGAAASDYLRLFALTAFGFMWARMAVVSLPKIAGEEAWFYKAKLATARFFMTRILPETSSLLTIISAGAKPLMQLEAEAF